MVLENVIRGIKNGYKFNYQYFALAVSIDGSPVPEVIINHYCMMDDKLTYIKKTYDKNGKHKNANIVIEDFAVGKDYEDIQIALGLKEVGF